MKSKNRYNYDDDDEYEEEERRHKSKKKKKKKKHIFLKILIVLLLIIAILAGVVVGGTIFIGLDKYNKIDYQEIDKNEIEINENVTTTGYINIALFGVDARDQEDSYKDSLSDVIMIVSINQDTKKVKIASVYRDTYLQNTKTKSFDKITHAYMSGGPKESLSTLNTNLDLDLTDYVAINFNVVVDIVNAVRWS